MAEPRAKRFAQRAKYLAGALGCAVLAYLALLIAASGWSETDLAGNGYDLWIFRRQMTAGLVFSSPLVALAYLLNRAIGFPRAEKPTTRVVFLVATSVLCGLALVLFLESNFFIGLDESPGLQIAAAGCVAAALVTGSRI